MTEELGWIVEPVRHVNEYRAHTSVLLPLSALELQFVAEGPQMGGHFEVSRTGKRGSADVFVDIQADYRREHALRNVTVYHFHSQNDEHGVKISVSVLRLCSEV